MYSKIEKIFKYLAFVSIAPAIFAILYGIFFDKKSKLAGTMTLLSAGMFVIFGITSAMLKGSFYMTTNAIDKEKNPTSFVFCIIIGYSFGISLLILSMILFQKGFK